MSIGYGATWRAKRQSRVATLPIGYGDGYPRALSNKASVLVGGRRCPVIGSVTMDQIMVVYPRHKIVVDAFIERAPSSASARSVTAATWPFFAPETTPNNSFAPIRSFSKVSSRHSASTSGALTSADERLQAIATSTLRRQLSVLRHLFQTASTEWAVPLQSNPLDNLRIGKAPRHRER